MWSGEHCTELPGSAMSSFSRSKDYKRSESPPSSPSPTAKTHERLTSIKSADANRAPTSTSAYTKSDSRLPSTVPTEEEPQRDFKKLYESAYNENEKLKSNLREAQLELVNIKAKLERVVKKQDHSSSQVGLLESEKRKKRVLERRMSEMEDDLKVLTDLKSDNQRLKDENGALIRVISKLSK